MAPVSPSRRRSGGPLGLAAAVAAITIGAAGCSIDLSHLRPGGGQEEEPPEATAEPVAAAPVLEEALAELAGYPALSVQGQIAESPGAQVQDASVVVADSGAASGTIRQEGAEAQLIGADGRLFIKAPDVFWLDKGVFGPDFGDYTDNWVRVSGSQAGIDPAAVLAPPLLSEILSGIGLGSEDALEENLDGTPAYRIDLEGEKNRMWVDAEDGLPLRIEIEQLAPEDADSGPQVRLDLSEPEPEQIEELYDGLLATAEEELSSSRDARIEVGWEGQADMDCEDGPACRIFGTVRDVGTSGQGKIRVRMDASFTNDELGEQTCSDSGTLEAGGTLEVSCGVNYNLTSTQPRQYEINGEAVLSTRGLTEGAQEEMIEALTEQREATLSADGPQDDGDGADGADGGDEGAEDAGGED